MVVDQILLQLRHVIIHNQDEEVLRQTLYALGYLASFGDKFRQHFVENGIVQYLVELLKHDDVVIVEYSLSVLNEIASGTDEHRQHVLDFNVVSCIPDLLGLMKGKIQREALNFLMIMLAGSRAHAQIVIDGDFLKFIVEKLLKGGCMAKNAVQSLSAFTEKADSDQLAYLIKIGATLPLSNLLANREEGISSVSKHQLH